MESENVTVLWVQRDGNMWCATYSDFINLQESPAGFGDTIPEAIQDLLEQEVRP